MADINKMMPVPNPKQVEFFKARTKYTAYGGARGGGKSWAIRWKATLGALKFARIKILIIRRTYPELNENHILPLMSMLNGIAKYTDKDKAFVFTNGSRIKLGYCFTDADLSQYQGQEYDWIFIDEATQITEYQFNTFKACLRGVNNFDKRIYITCNPGGVGHQWVRRLFIDRQYREGEIPEEHSFIQARVYDNTALMESDPGYLRNLQSLPEERRKAWLDGSWDIFSGQYFSEFNRDIHVIKPFLIPPHWQRFRCLDYGQDTTACLWCAVDNSGRIYTYRELHEPGLNLSDAAKRIVVMTDKTEDIRYTVASPDLWNRRQERGESGVEIMLKAGLAGLRRADNKRIPGWRLMREYLKVTPDEYGNDSAMLLIFENCHALIKSIPSLLYDEKKREDVAGEPHEYTHAPEALRYGLRSRPPLPSMKIENEEPLPDKRTSHRKKQTIVGGKSVNIRGLF